MARLRRLGCGRQSCPSAPLRVLDPRNPNPFSMTRRFAPRRYRDLTGEREMNDDWSIHPFAGRRLALAILTLLPFFGSAHPAAAQDRRGAKALVTRSPVASVSTQSGYTS